MAWPSESIALGDSDPGIAISAGREFCELAGQSLYHRQGRNKWFEGILDLEADPFLLGSGMDRHVIFGASWATVELFRLCVGVRLVFLPVRRLERDRGELGRPIERS